MRGKKETKRVITDRAMIVLSKRQHEILCDLLSGLDTAQTAESRGITKSTVRHVKSRLRTIFKAKSITHLMVLAILETKYYRILTVNAKNHHSKEISEKEVQIIKYVLNGWYSKEIAAPTNLNVRTIESHRYEFYKKCNVSNNRDLINACLQNGILKFIPFEFELTSSNIDGMSIDKLSMSINNFHLDSFTNTINEHGFIYFDFQNRFVTTDSIDSSLYSYFQVNPYILSLVLSGIPFAIITDISEMSERFLAARHKEIIERIKQNDGYLKFYELLEDLGFYHPVTSNFKMPRISRLSILLFVEGIEKCLSIEEKVEITKLDVNTISRQESILLAEFNCETELALIAHAMHLGIFGRN